VDPLAQFVASIPVFLLAIILHEVAHGYVAYRFGDDTAKRAGRLTMNPIPHIDPLGAIVFVATTLLPPHRTFGWAKPVPVNPMRLRPQRLGDVLVSVAGVATNLLQAGVWAVLLRVLLGLSGGSSLAVAAAELCLLGVEINVLLFVFNLLPLPPLDGFHLITGALGLSGSYAVRKLEAIGFLLLFALMWFGVIGLILSYVADPVMRLFLPGA
jgi:Zn-dependent protease